MHTKKYYYDEQLRKYYFEKYYQTFTKCKDSLKESNTSELLSLQTKPTLTDIAKRLDIKGYSKLGKDRLVNLVSAYITDNIDNILCELSYKELNLLKELAKEDLVEYSFSIDNLNLIGGLSSLGVLFKLSIKDSYYLVVPSDIKEGINSLTSSKKYISNLKERSEGINLIDGLMTHYGLLLGGELYSIITNKESKVFKEENLDFYLNYIFRSYEAFTEGNALIHPFLFSPEDVYEELRVRQTIQYNFSNEDFFVSLGRDFKDTWGEEVLELKNILSKTKLKKSDIDSLISQLIFYIKNDMDTQIIVELLTSYSLDLSNKALADSIVNSFSKIFNNTPIWSLKGLTPSESTARQKTTIIKDKEPGRNDPCPCGSGKKYKKCCGR
ncbi:MULTISPECIES: SEC-C metal-binding domain-containing protein [Clostridium]|uniref:SEC-C metal-binding domain-containing protein n=1 Tax=Clostridium TaxID=1485 RepID=UPI0018A0B645|nr:MULTISPECIES: SEC-C metal-binding domain-containing protein [Clostridium]MDB2092275.1 SEC-C metal-binding domain-containing protein [Clostridium paraputrificum]MDB2117591.1 SEC-C metal-binding domain-containing protein [Clostridium paraputrificum]MDU5739239.1 SEC-C metal-binding domain-containing protein [Clostridium sp.]MDU5784352.1 SEC-C metal-binding domain-containing protein [Clostridium sp.]